MLTPVSQAGGCEELPSQKMKKDEKLVGHVLYFYTYSMWQGRVLWIEDLFVRAEYRSKFILNQILFSCIVMWLERSI